jgi:hypothetical protein
MKHNIATTGNEETPRNKYSGIYFFGGRRVRRDI